MGVKRLEDMIRTKQFGDVKFSNIVTFLRGFGFEEAGGTNHLKMKRKEKGPFKTNMIIVPRRKVLRKDQVRYILNQLGFV